ncbi:MAG TPA: SGNH/GDSL hydrolase family protein [Candidatus Limnocylindrales bacterium]
MKCPGLIDRITSVGVVPAIPIPIIEIRDPRNGNWCKAAPGQNLRVAMVGPFGLGRIVAPAAGVAPVPTCYASGSGTVVSSEAWMPWAGAAYRPSAFRDPGRPRVSPIPLGMDAGYLSRGLAACKRVAGVFVCLAILFSAGCSSGALPTCSPKAASCTRVLFLGNSYTYVNDLPGTFGKLANSAGRQVEVAVVANGGETLADHAASTDSTGRIASEHWNYVVLQEQSETPASSSGAQYYMYPAARTLAARAEGVGATPMFFMTWAHRDGLPSAGLPDYKSMQTSINSNYLAIATELHVPVAAVGYAWWFMRQDHPEITMWADDGSHPSPAGTYLAACVFYASIFRTSPVGIAFHGGLSDRDAGTIQDEANQRVFDPAWDWGLR